MALKELDINPCAPPTNRGTRKTGTSESAQTDTKPNAANVAAVEEEKPIASPRVRPSVVASLEKSIEQNAAVWKALANH